MSTTQAPFWDYAILATAAGSALLSIVLYASMVRSDVEFLPALIFLVPGLLVFVGAFALVRRRRHWGVAVLWPVGIVNPLIIVVTFPGIAYVVSTTNVGCWNTCAGICDYAPVFGGVRSAGASMTQSLSAGSTCQNRER
jgi:hypothetical protein